MRCLLILLLIGLQDGEVRRLIGQLQSDEPEVREAARVELRKLGPAARPALEEAARGAGEAAVRARDLLWRLDWEPLVPDWLRRARPVFFEEIQSPAERLKLFAHGGCVVPAAVPRLVLDPDPEIAKAALSLAKQTRAGRAAAREWLRRWSMHSCSKACAARHHEWVDALRPAFIAGEPAEAAAHDELLRSGFPEARLLAGIAVRKEPVLLEFAVAGNPHASLAAWFLGRMKSRAAVPALILLLETEVRDAAAEALVRIGDAAARAPLERIVRDAPELSREVAYAWAQLAGADAVPAFLHRWAAREPDTIVAGYLLEAGREEVIDRVLAMKAEALAKFWWYGSDFAIRDPLRVRRLFETGAAELPASEFARDALKKIPPAHVRPVARTLLAQGSPSLQELCLRCLDPDQPEDRAAMEAWAARILEDPSHEHFMRAGYAAAARPCRAMIDRIGETKSGYELLSKFAAPSDTGELTALLGGVEHAQERYDVLRALWKSGGEAGRRRVEEEVRAGSDAALVLLLEAEPDRGGAAVERHLGGGRALSHWTLRCYIERRKEAAVPHLLPLLKRRLGWDAEEEVMNGLLVHAPRAVLEPALQAIVEERSERGEAALAKLSEWGNPAALRVLEARLGEELRREEHLELAARAGLAAVEPFLLKDILSPSADERVAALRNLCRLGRASDPGIVVRSLRLDGEGVRRAAAALLGRIGHKAAGPDLLEALRDARRDLILAAESARALEAMGDPSWMAVVKAWGEPATELQISDYAVHGANYGGPPAGRISVHHMKAGELLERLEGPRIEVSEKLRPQLESGLQPRCDLSVLGVLEEFRRWRIDAVCTWEGDRLLFSTSEEALARRGRK